MSSERATVTSDGQPCLLSEPFHRVCRCTPPTSQLSRSSPHIALILLFIRFLQRPHVNPALMSPASRFILTDFLTPTCQFPSADPSLELV